LQILTFIIIIDLFGRARFKTIVLQCPANTIKYVGNVGYAREKAKSGKPDIKWQTGYSPKRVSILHVPSPRVLPLVSPTHVLPVKNTPHKHPAVGVNLLDLDRKTLYELDFIEKCVCPTADAVAG
jgi:hypothetical protein